ncbi:MAG: hypothetical protein KDD44_09575, partial [Bdellovibrionales bacterium]|nr:hypothetical protein [Bdellovibrionales bacterium]
SNATAEFEYLDFNLTPLVLPLTNTAVVNSLRSIRVTVTVKSDSPLSSGTPATATVTQVVGLRNLNYPF